MTVKSFTVFHKNPEARKALGRGFVVGKVEQKTSYQYQGTLPNTEIISVITEEKIAIKYEVLWENNRRVSPSLHLCTDLEWEMLTDEYMLAMEAEDEDEEEEEESEEEVSDMRMLEQDETPNVLTQPELNFNNDNSENATTI